MNKHDQSELKQVPDELEILSAHPAISYSKLKIETVEQGVQYVQRSQ